MKFPGSSLLRIAGVIVVLLGVAAMAAVTAPFVYGQSRSRAPVTALRTQVLGGSYIGVSVRDTDAADAQRAKLQQATGAVIDEVRGDSPAAKAGLRAGDVITRFDDERVRSARHFERLVADTPDGREVAMTVVRAGANVDLRITPEAAPSAFAFTDSLRSSLRDLDARMPELRDFEFRMPDNFTVAAPRIEVNPRLGYSLVMRGRLGVGVQDLTDQLAEYFGATGGVLVTSVDDDTPARAAGLKAGDVITKVDGEDVNTTAELRRRLDRAEGEITLTIIRDRREQTIKVDLGEARAVRRIIR